MGVWVGGGDGVFSGLGLFCLPSGMSPAQRCRVGVWVCGCVGVGGDGVCSGLGFFGLPSGMSPAQRCRVGVCVGGWWRRGV